MRIAIVHSFYVSATPSGENLAVLREAEALTNAGHEVQIIARHTDELAMSRLYPLKSALRVATGWGGDPTDELMNFKPDVTHVHNLFPNIGTTWLPRWEGPLVATLHNFRPLCANGILFREGNTCTECPDESTLSALKHACYRDSKLATIPIALATSGGLQRNRLIDRAQKVIVLSERAKSIYRQYGLPEEKIIIIPNGLDIAIPPNTREMPKTRWIAVGRLTAEKGFADLVRLWPVGLNLDIIGEGPEAELIRAVGKSNVTLSPVVPNSELIATLPGYVGLILPSKWFEGLPTVALEALGSGLPVVAHTGNSASDFLLRHEPAWVYDGSGSSLAATMAAIESRGTEARTRARQLFDEEFSLEIWVSRLEALFNSLVGSERPGGGID
jgi:glycosyltransferase involved in cell wall biosynthesis